GSAGAAAGSAGATARTTGAAARTTGAAARTTGAAAGSARATAGPASAAARTTSTGSIGAVIEARERVRGRIETCGEPQGEETHTGHDESTVEAQTGHDVLVPCRDAGCSALA